MAAKQKHRVRDGNLPSGELVNEGERLVRHRDCSRRGMPKRGEDGKKSGRRRSETGRRSRRGRRRQHATKEYPSEADTGKKKQKSGRGSRREQRRRRPDDMRQKTTGGVEQIRPAGLETEGEKITEYDAWVHRKK
jgi:hypothetical protein